MDGISVIIPCYNREALLQETLQSVVSQECDGPIEILVVDDGSTDRSLDIATSFGPPVRVLTKPDNCTSQGPGAARNRGICEARYPFIAFLDSDDVFCDGHLKGLARTMHEKPDVGLVFGDAYEMNATGETRWIRRYRVAEPITPAIVLLDPFFQTSSVMIRKAVFDKVEMFDESLRQAEDYDLWVRITETFRVEHVSHFGTAYRQHDDQLICQKEQTWMFAQVVLDRARKRFPYPRRLLRKRQAVLNYRFAQVAISKREYFRACRLLASSFILDPIRSFHVLLGRDK